MTARILNIADLSTELGTDPRTTRKFLRSITPVDAQPGKGSRWGIPATQVRSLKAKYTKFAAEVAAAKATPEVTTDEADAE